MLTEKLRPQLDRRSFLRKSGLAAGGVASIAALAPFSSLAQEGQNAPRKITGKPRLQRHPLAGSSRAGSLGCATKTCPRQS